LRSLLTYRDVVLLIYIKPLFTFGFEPVNLPVKINFWNILMLENLFCIPVIDFSLAVRVHIN